MISSSPESRTSTPHRLAIVLRCHGGDSDRQLTAGSDLRYVRQELDEFARSEENFDGGNSPIPKSHQSNPGFFLEHRRRLTEDISVNLGGRLDPVSANIDDSEADLQQLGLPTPQLPFDEIVGTDDFDRDYLLASAWVDTDILLTPWLNLRASAGYSERPPTLTELYAADSFMFLLQNGLNTVRGDPRLAPERLTQLDIGLEYERGRWRAGLNGFHAWVRDYITWENITPAGSAGWEQVNLLFVNTDLATLAGGELFGELSLSQHLTAFGTLSYV